MPTKLNGYNLPDKTIDQMKIIYNKSVQLNSELGFVLCSDKTGDLHARNICSGEDCSIEIKSKCEKEEKFAGTYHTHPSSNSDASANDLSKCGFVHNACIGADDKTTCYIWKHTPITKEKHSEFVKLLSKGIEKIDDQIYNKNFECIKDLGPYSIIEDKMPGIDKKIVDEYQMLKIAKQEKTSQCKIEEMEKALISSLRYRNMVASKTIMRIGELLPKYYKEKVLW
jgi:proteasome lid subunit RPN8/RPN11